MKMTDGLFHKVFDEIGVERGHEWWVAYQCGNCHGPDGGGGGAAWRCLAGSGAGGAGKHEGDERQQQELGGHAEVVRRPRGRSKRRQRRS